MNNNEPNKIVSSLFKEFLKMRAKTEMNDFDYKRQLEINAELAKITTVTGAIEVMSKNSLLKLLKMQSSWRFMALHTFLIYCAKAADDTFNITD